MTQMEMKKMIDNRKAVFEQRLSQDFKQIQVNGEKCFCMPSGVIFTITPLYSFNSIVIEYADDLSCAKNNSYEDGDLFGIEDYEENEMFKMMLQEINQ